MLIHSGIILFLLSNILFTYIIWIFMKLREIDVGLLKFYVIIGIICGILSFMYFKSLFLLFSILVHVIFLMLQGWLQTNKIIVSIYALINGILFFKLFENFLKGLDVLNIVSLSLLGLYSALAFFNLILGHWYLVSPGMSIKHFRDANITFSISGILRIVFLIVAFIVLNRGFSFSLFKYSYLDGLFLGKIIFLQLAAFIISFLSANALKWRSTQAATGFFYCISVFALSDFIVSLYLLNNKYYIF